MLKLCLNSPKKKRLALPGSTWHNTGAFPAQQSIAHLMESSLTLTFLAPLLPRAALLAQLQYPSSLKKGSIHSWTSEKKLQVFKREQSVQGSPLPLSCWKLCTTKSPADAFSEHTWTDGVELQLKMFPFMRFFTASSHGKLFHISQV